MSEDWLKIQSKGSIYWINPNRVETIRHLESGEVRLEFASGRVDYYRGEESAQIVEQLNGHDYPSFEKLPKLEELID